MSGIPETHLRLGGLSAAAPRALASLIALLALTTLSTLLASCSAPTESGEGRTAVPDVDDDRAALESLVTAGAKPRRALRRAAARGRCDRLQLLLEAGVDARGLDGAAALARSLTDGKPECEDHLREAGASLVARGASGRNLLTAAVEKSEIETSRRILSAGFPPDEADRHDRTALAIAIAITTRDGSTELAAVLLDGGANPNSLDRDGWSPLFHAARAGGLDLARRLLESGADPNLRSTLGWTPLLVALEAGEHGMATLLLDHGADPSASSPAAGSALAWAARAGAEDMASTLLAHGASPAAPVDGRSPAWWARANGHEALAEMLESHRAGSRTEDGDG